MPWVDNSLFKIFTLLSIILSPFLIFVQNFDSVYKPPDINCSMGWNDSMLNDTTQCFPNVTSIDRMLAYRICVIIFACLLGPFIFFNIQKTTWLQIITTLLRWLGESCSFPCSNLMRVAILKAGNWWRAVIYMSECQKDCLTVRSKEQWQWCDLMWQFQEVNAPVLFISLVINNFREP